MDVAMKKSMLFEAVTVLLLIFSVFLLLVMISGSDVDDTWTKSGIVAPPSSQDLFEDRHTSMFSGENGVLYTIDGRNIHAIDPEGNILWTLDIPDVYTLSKDDWSYNVTVVGQNEKWYGRDAAIRDNNLYVLLEPENPYVVNAVLLAVDSSGRLMWNLAYTSSMRLPYDYKIGFGNPDRIYLHNNTLYTISQGFGGLSAISLNGSLLQWIEDVESMPSFDEDGTYYIKGVLRPKNISYSWNGTQYNDNRTIEAYYPDGALKWQRTFKDLNISQYNISIDLVYATPEYRNCTIFVWGEDGMVALDRDGSTKWEQRQEGLRFNGCAFDQNGTIYLSYSETTDKWPYIKSTAIFAIDWNGNMIARHDRCDPGYYFNGLKSLPDGVLYTCTRSPLSGNDTYPPDPEDRYYYHDVAVLYYLKEHNGTWDLPIGLRDLDTIDVTAYDLHAGQKLWSYRIPLDRTTARITEDNVREIIPHPYFIETINRQSPDEWYKNNSIPAGSKGITSSVTCDLLSANDRVYVNMWSANYEMPAFYNRSKCVYSGGIYAFDKSGNLTWHKSTSSRVISMQEVNGTIFYSTGDGKLSASKTGFVTGVIAAALYLFIRFFLIGTLSRAKARIDKNENRNRILQCIMENPASSLHDISKILKINIGTVRYHLLILGINHRIVSCKADDKYVRYFINSRSYTEGQQYVISLMRRDPIRRMLTLLFEKPELSNVEISKELGIDDSSAIRTIKELFAKGIVTKLMHDGNKTTYSISEEYRDNVACAIDVLYRKTRTDKVEKGELSPVH